MSRSARRLPQLIAVAVLLVGGATLPAAAAATEPHLATIVESPSEGSGVGSEVSPREVQLEDEVFEPASSLVVIVVAMAVIGGAAFMGRRGRR